MSIKEYEILRNAKVAILTFKARNSIIFSQIFGRQLTMKKFLSALMVILVAFSIMGCSKDNNQKSNSSSNNSSKTQSSGFDSEALISQLETKEYKYENSDGTYWIFYEIKNNSDRSLQINVTGYFYDGNTQVYTKADQIDALDSGSCYLLYFAPDKTFDRSDYSIDVSAAAGESAELSCEMKVNENNIELVTVTNNGDKISEVVKGYILYFSDDTLVDFDMSFYSGTDSEIKAGESVTKNCDTDEEYNSYKMFVNAFVKE